MSVVNRIMGDLYVAGNITRTGTGPAMARTDLTQENLARFKIKPTDWRTWDAMATNLPGTAATDDLALITGTLGTHSPTIQTGDLKAAGATTRYAACTFEVPHTYVAGETVTIRAHAGMKTTVADNSATVDFQVYLSDDEEGVSADLCTTNAQDINDTVDADFDFQITSTSVQPGDTLQIRMAVAVNDAATGTAVIGQVGGVEVLLDVKG
jgi:hypothetical protein